MDTAPEEPPRGAVSGVGAGSPGQGGCRFPTPQQGSGGSEIWGLRGQSGGNSAQQAEEPRLQGWRCGGGTVQPPAPKGGLVWGLGS